MSADESDSLSSIRSEEEIEDPMCDILTDYLVNDKGESIAEILTLIYDELKALRVCLQQTASKPLG